MADTTHEAPPGHGYHAMAYDTSAARILLFGGQTGDDFAYPDLFLSGDTWSYDPARNDWRRLETTGRPPALAAHAMVYHAAGRRTLVYGGVRWTDQKTPQLVRETWSLDYRSSTWTRVSDGPPVRYGHRMVFDAGSGVIVLFGGACVDAAKRVNNKKLDDTWVYHLEADRWEEMSPSPSPSPRHYHGMAYDARAGKVIVFGGAQDGSADASSVWIYDYRSNTWTERSPGAGPPPLYYHAMDYDVRADKSVVYGGLTQGSDETWVYDHRTNTWERRRPVRSPGRLSRMPMVYVPALHGMALFGGQTDARQFVYSDATWIYDVEADTWTDRTSRHGDYVGQRTPGAVPEVFAPGVVSSDLYEHGAPAFTPDGSALYWSVYWEKEDRQAIFRIRREDGRWLAPEKAPFVDERYLDGNPVFSRDGKRLYFTSNRPLREGGEARGHSLWIWFVEAAPDGWSRPRPLAASFSDVSLASAPAFAPDGALFIVLWQGKDVTPFDIYSATPLPGRYEGLRRLPDAVNSGSLEEYPFEARDGSYLLFSSARPGGLGKEDLYVSLRGEDGSWLPARCLGPGINSPASERFPYMTPDGKFFFFGSDRNGSLDYYWVEAGVIDGPPPGR